METKFVNFFNAFSFKFLNIVCCDRIKTHANVTSKNFKVSMRPPKIVLYECSSTVDFFKKEILTFSILFSQYYIQYFGNFSNLKFKIGKR